MVRGKKKKKHEWKVVEREPSPNRDPCWMRRLRGESRLPENSEYKYDIQNRTCLCIVQGPDDTQFEGLTIRISFEFTEKYPFKPPDYQIDITTEGGTGTS